MCAKSVKEEYGEELSVTKDENKPQRQVLDAGFNKPQDDSHRAGRFVHLYLKSTFMN